MGKKIKIGKQRRDKYYHLAKEAGYRSRAAFKLIQLNKRFEFLQRSKALVDLCAAPGGWLQVASQNMPVDSIRIGVDLVSIKAIPNCITLQGDITQESTRSAIKKQLQKWEADCVLHDGAPNVGQNWGHDAFQQNCLTLSALRLASQVLRKHGYFVTKIFRSADSHALIKVFEKLFKRVHVWKPAASRLESAEIFVVCEKYLKPSTVDPDLLDVKQVFKQSDDPVNKINPLKLLNPQKKVKKVRPEGYADGVISLYSELRASVFFETADPLLLLSQASRILLDEPLYENSPHTTMEIRECLRDIKVCGPAELRQILMWRRKIMADLKKEERLKDKANEVEKSAEETAEEKEIRELEEIDDLIRNAKASEKAKLKKKKRKIQKERARAAERKKYQMTHEGDEPTIGQDQEIFSLRDIQRALERQKSRAASAAAAKITDKLEEEYASGDDEMDAKDGVWETTNPGVESDNDSGLDNDDYEELPHEDLLMEEDSYLTENERSLKNTDEWYSRISGILSDSTGKGAKNANEELDMDEDDEEQKEKLDAIAKHMQRRMSKVKFHENTVLFDDAKNKKSVGSLNDSKDDLNKMDDGEVSSTDEDSEYEDFEQQQGTRVRKRKADLVKKMAPDAKKAKYLTPAQLAMGELMIYSSRTRRDLEDFGWNRYTNNDTLLPDWFVEDEKKHCQKELPVNKERVDFYKERQKDLNVRPIKKVIEAKARKKKRQARRLAKAKKRAENIMDNEGLEHGEKVREMKKAYRKALTPEKKDIKYQVMTKGKRGSGERPKGPYRVVDKRLKKDKRADKASSKRGKSGAGRGAGNKSRSGGRKPSGGKRR